MAARGLLGYNVLSAENDPRPVVVGNGIFSLAVEFLILPSLGTLSRSLTIGGIDEGALGVLDRPKLGRARSSIEGLDLDWSETCLAPSVVVVRDLTRNPSGKGGGLGVDSFSLPLPLLNKALSAPDDFFNDNPDDFLLSSFSLSIN